MATPTLATRRVIVGAESAKRNRNDLRIPRHESRIVDKYSSGRPRRSVLNPGTYCPSQNWKENPRTWKSDPGPWRRSSTDSPAPCTLLFPQSMYRDMSLRLASQHQVNSLHSNLMGRAHKLVTVTSEHRSLDSIPELRNSNFRHMGLLLQRSHAHVVDHQTNGHQL